MGAGTRPPPGGSGDLCGGFQERRVQRFPWARRLTLGTLGTLDRVSRESGDETLPAAVATLLNTTAEEVVAFFGQFANSNK